MKKIFLLSILIVGLRGAALSQGSPPITVTEVDGSPKITGVTRITVSNGTLTKSGTRATITTGGGGGSPGGSDTQLQFNNAGAFGGVSGATSDGTNVTFGSANLRATSPRFTTSLLDANGNGMFTFTATGSAVNGFGFTNAATGNSPTLSAVGSDTDISLTFSPKGAGLNVLTKNVLFNVGTGFLDNLFYVGSTAADPVDASFGFFVAGNGSANSSKGPYFLARGNAFNGSTDQRGTMFFVAGNPDSASGNMGAIRFLTGNEVERLRITREGMVQYFPINLTDLGTPTNGSTVFCGDCAEGSDPCTGSSTGALAVRLNGRWRCL